MSRPWRRLSTVVVALAVVVAACAGDDTPDEEGTVTSTSSVPTSSAPTSTTTVAPETTTTTVADATPRHGGEVVIGAAQEPPTLNPYVPGGDNFIVQIVGQSYFTGVQDVDGYTLELIPDVVTDLPDTDNGGVVINDDGTMTVTYEIREEAVWSDGTPISGADFQFTLDTILSPDLPVDTATYEDIVSTDVGDKTFTFTLAAPTTAYELLFGLTEPLIPAHAVADSDFLNDWNSTIWPAGGPFEFADWQQGESITLSRNDNYWKTDNTGEALPYLDQVIFRFIPETEGLINAFRAREIDVFNPDPAPEVIETLEALEPEGAVVEVLSGPFWEHLTFSFSEERFERNPDSLNANLAYRQAVAHAIDRELIIDEMLAGQVEPLDSFVEAYDPSLSQAAWAEYGYDPERSRQLVEQVKQEEGVDTVSAVFTTTSNNDARVQMSELFVDMFAEVGIEYRADLEDSELFFGETTVNGNYDLGQWAWFGTPGFSGLVSLMDLFDPEAHPLDGGQNYYYFGVEGSSLINDNTRRFAEIRDELNSSVDEAVLIPLIAEAEQILADEMALVPLYARLDVGAVWADEIGGFKHNPTEAGLTWNIEEWFRSDLP